MVWVTSKVQSAGVIVPCREEKKCLISLEVVGKPNTDISVRMVNNRPIIRIKVKTEVNLADRSSFQVNTTDDYIHYLEEQFNKAVKSEIEAAFQKAVKKYHADIFGFGTELEDNHLAQWNAAKKDWEETLLPSAKLTIEVDAKIRYVTRKLYSPWVKQ